MHNIVLQFSDVSVAYNQNTILQRINFQMEMGEFCYLVGRTGSGKSSILKLIYADIFPSSGTVQIGNFLTNNLKKDAIPNLRRKLGIVFQDFQLLPDRSVADNLKFVMLATGWTNSEKIKQQTNDLLQKVGLSSKLNAFPYQLSGGEQQRVAIARALVNDPILIIADEPTGNLDSFVTEHIMDLLKEINASGTAILMATHEKTLFDKYPARIIECKNGTVEG